MKAANIALTMLVIVLAWLSCPDKADAIKVTVWGACVIGLWLTIKTQRI